jgi:hypothetical protein
VIAGNNILNALFMMVSSALLMVGLGAGVSIPGIFLTLAILTAAVAAGIFAAMPEFIQRFTAWLKIIRN